MIFNQEQLESIIFGSSDRSGVGNQPFAVQYRFNCEAGDKAKGVKETECISFHLRTRRNLSNFFLYSYDTIE